MAVAIIVNNITNTKKNTVLKNYFHLVLFSHDHNFSVMLILGELWINLDTLQISYNSPDNISAHN